MRNQAGFTLQEVMIPNYLGWMPRHRLESGTSDVVMALNAARLEAIKGFCLASRFVGPDRDEELRHRMDREAGEKRAE